MKKYLIYVLLFAQTVSASEMARDYGFYQDELDMYDDYSECSFWNNDPIEVDDSIFSSNEVCLKHYTVARFSEIGENLLQYLPSIRKSRCRWCSNEAIYLGYIDPRFRRYFTNVARQLEYTKEYSECKCMWPELSQEAAEISNDAHELFFQLFTTTALDTLSADDFLLDQFRNTAFSGFSHHLDPVVFCVVRQFRFSDYFHLCRDIENFAKNHFDKEDAREIKNDLNMILGQLYEPFVSLYKRCLKRHPNSEIQQELAFTKFFAPKSSEDEFSTDPVEEFVNRQAYGVSFWKANERGFRPTALNIRPLFVETEFDLIDPMYKKERADACYILLKRLLEGHYGGEEFYEIANKKFPKLADNLIHTWIEETKKLRAEFPSTGIIRTPRDIAKLPHYDNLLNYLRYNIFNGNRLTRKPFKKGYEGYYSFEELTSCKNTDYLMSVWLSPRPLLMALFQDEDVVAHVMRIREEIYLQQLQGNDSAATRDQLRYLFEDKVNGINPKFIDFRISLFPPVQNSITIVEPPDCNLHQNR